MARPWGSLAAEIQDIHRLFRAAADRANDALSLDVKAPVQMVVKVAGENGEMTSVAWVEELDWKAYAVGISAHTREHQAQVERTLEAIQNS
jgi:hypothetical protein